MTKIIDIMHMKVEDEKDDQYYVWYRSKVIKDKDFKAWSSKPAFREDFNPLFKINDEAIAFIFEEDDGKKGIVIWSADPQWTDAQLWLEISDRIKNIDKKDEWIQVKVVNG